MAIMTFLPQTVYLDFLKKKSKLKYAFSKFGFVYLVLTSDNYPECISFSVMLNRPVSRPVAGDAVVP